MAEELISQTTPEEMPEQQEQINEKNEKKIVLLKERYEINFRAPLDNLNCNGAKAYKVNDRIDTRRELFALVASKDTCPRSSFLPYLK